MKKLLLKWAIFAVDYTVMLCIGIVITVVGFVVLFGIVVGLSYLMGCSQAAPTSPSIERPVVIGGSPVDSLSDSAK